MRRERPDKYLQAWLYYRAVELVGWDAYKAAGKAAKGAK